MNIPTTFTGFYEIHSTIDGKKEVFKGPTKEFDIDQLKQLKLNLNASDIYVSKTSKDLILPEAGKMIELTNNNTGIRLKASAIMFDLLFNKDNTETQVHKLLNEVIKKVDQLKTKLLNNNK